MRVHDGDTEIGARRIRDFAPDNAKAAHARHYDFADVWRPIRPAGIDKSLALCDTPGLTGTDPIVTDPVCKDRVGESAADRRALGPSGVFFPSTTRAEVVPIECHDTARDRRPRISFRSAFIGPTAGAGAPPRLSTEIRTAAYIFGKPIAIRAIGGRKLEAMSDDRSQRHGARDSDRQPMGKGARFLRRIAPIPGLDESL
jgi:hypothetical protein